MRNAIIGALLAALAAALLWGWRAQQRAAVAQDTLGLDSARVVSAAFTVARQLKVYNLDGTVLVEARDAGFLRALPATQKTKLPFTVEYFVDLSKLAPADYRWAARTGTMTVAVPDVEMGAPRVNSAGADTVQSGLLIPRGVGLRLAKATAVAAAARAREFGGRVETMARARDAARVAIAALTRAPLTAAGLRNVTVAVRFPSDVRGGNERWDESRPLADVLGNKDSSR